MSTSISEFERNKPKKTYQKIKDLKNLIKSEQEKTEMLYANRIATLDKMSKAVDDLFETFKKGE